MLISFNEIQTYNCMWKPSLYHKSKHTYYIIIMYSKGKLNMKETERERARGKQFIDVFYVLLLLLLLLFEPFSFLLWRGMSAWEVIIWHCSLTLLLSFVLLCSHNHAERHVSIYCFFSSLVPLPRSVSLLSLAFFSLAISILIRRLGST